MAIAAGCVILAVDEDPVMREFVRRILLGAGLGCVEAAAGESGLKLAVEAGVSAAVVNLVLPGMSGAELAWRLREEIPGLPVVVVSGRLDLWDADDLRDLGICKVLPKPFEQRKLVRAVADALAHPWRSRRPTPADSRRLESARVDERKQQEVPHGTH